jgi:protein disulfide-isomerase
MTTLDVRRVLLGGFLAACLTAVAAAAPYSESTDAKADIAAALVEAGRTRVPVLVVFGANWCGDCQALDKAFANGAAAPLISKNFKVVKVDVGRFDRNVSIAESYGVPLKSGIPAAAVLAPDGRVVYATKTGELSSARSMGDRGICAFFEKVARSVGK